jgi:hypothetical protein
MTDTINRSIDATRILLEPYEPDFMPVFHPANDNCGMGQYIKQGLELCPHLAAAYRDCIIRGLQDNFSFIRSLPDPLAMDVLDAAANLIDATIAHLKERTYGHACEKI